MRKHYCWCKFSSYKRFTTTLNSSGMPAKVIKFKSYLNNDDIIMLSKSFSSVLSDSLKSYSKYENS